MSKLTENSVLPSAFAAAGELQMVGFGLYTLLLDFQSGLHLVVYRLCKVREVNGRVRDWDAQTSIARDDPRIVTVLLGRDLESARIEGPDEMVLHFSDGRELILVVDPDELESFLIVFPSSVNLVF